EAKALGEPSGTAQARTAAGAASLTAAAPAATPTQPTKPAAIVGGIVEKSGAVKLKTSLSAMNQMMSTMMGDAPFCDKCGHTTVRNGTCYRCMNCGNSMGCS